MFYRKEAKELIKTSVNASIDDEIIFCDGSFTTPGEQFFLLLRKFYENFTKVILFVSVCEPLINLHSWIDAGAQVSKYGDRQT